VEVSGHVLVAGTNAPLANHEVEVWVLHEPPIPIAMGSYVKESSGTTDENGAFSFSVKVPRHRPFLLQTSGADGLPSGIERLMPGEVTTNLTMLHREPGFRHLIGPPARSTRPNRPRWMPFSRATFPFTMTTSNPSASLNGST
jgi:hypothetical protein